MVPGVCAETRTFSSELMLAGDHQPLGVLLLSGDQVPIWTKYGNSGKKTPRRWRRGKRDAPIPTEPGGSVGIGRARIVVYPSRGG